MDDATQPMGLRHRLVEIRLRIESAHQPLVFRWCADNPDACLGDVLPGLIEDGLRLQSGCQGHNSQSAGDALSSVVPVGNGLIRRLRVRLSCFNFPLLFAWLAQPHPHGSRAGALLALAELGLQSRLDLPAAPLQAPVTTAHPVPEPATPPAAAVPEQPAVAQSSDPGLELRRERTPEQRQQRRAMLKRMVAPLDG